MAVVEAPTPELTKLAATDLQARLEQRKEAFKSVRNIAGSPFFQQNGLMFLSTKDEVKDTAEKLAQGEPLIGSLATDPSLRGMTEALTTVLAGLHRGEVKIDDLAKPLDKFSETIETVLAKGDATFSWRELTNGGPLPASDLRAFVQIRPVLDFKALEPGRAAENQIRADAADLKLAEKYQARVRLTGPVAIANDEFGSTQEGIVVNSIVTCVIVLFILWMALRSAKIIAAVSIALAIGLAITTAVGLMLVGALNPISVAFAVLFVGLGVDFGIQFSVRYRTERHEHEELDLTLDNTARNMAVPLSLAAVAAAIGFLSFLPTAYQGVSELGKIAGAGMLIALLCTITVLPALLALLNPPGEKAEPGYAFLAPVDSFIERHRIKIVAVALVVAIAGLPLLYYLQVRLQPDEPAQFDRRVGRHLPRHPQGPADRRQRHRRDRAVAPGRAAGRGEAAQGRRGRSRDVGRFLRPEGSGHQARGDQEGRRRAGADLQGIQARGADRRGEHRSAERLGRAAEEGRRRQIRRRRRSAEPARHGADQACAGDRGPAREGPAGLHQPAAGRAGADLEPAARQARHVREPAEGSRQPTG